MVRKSPGRSHHRAHFHAFYPNKKARLSAKTLHMKVDYNPYEGREVRGAAETVISRGRVIVEAGKFTGRAGSGSFLRRSTR
jgi:dihydropyrimidinase